jgi:hypothetical protein
MAGKPRAKVRLRLDRGTALVKEMGVGTVVCDVMDVSEGGCACRLVFSRIGTESIENWQAVLIPGRILTLDLSESLDIPDMVIPEAQIRWVQSQRSTEVIFGVSFSGLNEEHKRSLARAIMMLASRKLRGRKPLPLPEQPKPAETPAAEAQPSPAVLRTRTPVAPVPRSIKKFETQVIKMPVRSQDEQSPQESAPPPKTSAGSSSRLRAQPRLRDTDWQIESAASGKKESRKDIRALERQKRHPADFPVLIDFADASGRKLSRKAEAGRVIDFNETGFMIEAPGPDFCSSSDLIDRHIQMLATLQVGANELAAKLQIVSVKPGAGQFLHYGLRILDMPETDRSFLRELYIRASLSNIKRRG